jgi:hypothetical protein
MFDDGSHISKPYLLICYNFIPRRAVETQANNKIGTRRYSDMANRQKKLAVDCNLHENICARIGISSLIQLIK